MYCKNCGEEVNENAAICVKCGFSVGVGTKYCAHCGKELAEGQAICMNCGFYVNKGAAKATEKEPTQQQETAAAICDEYRGTVKKNLYFSIAKNALTLALVLALLFLPIFRYERDPSDMSMDDLLNLDVNDVESLEDLEDLFTEDGKITRSFSLYNDLSLLVNAFSDEGRSSSPDDTFLLFYEGLFPLFTVIMMIMLSVMVGKQLFAQIQDLQNIDERTLLIASEMKKSGEVKKKKSFFKQQTVYALFMYIIFDVIFSKFFDSIFLMGGMKSVRHMGYIAGVSGWLVLVIVLLGAYVFVEAKQKRGEEQMLLSITQKEYQQS
ncbi:MAG: zinc ribbon domain-containing protein [Clostridia bacterium]|nr:zinc ribbon domain-containing protein [Clostridia bacterium]